MLTVFILPCSLYFHW